MADVSIFMDKDRIPAADSLSESLQDLFPVWQEVAAYALSASKGSGEEWNYSKLGWNYRIKGKKSVIIYMMPCEKYFIASFVLGKKATEQVLSGTVSESIKATIRNAKVYREGRGFRITVADQKIASDIKILIDIKLSAAN
jgi:hypothetical protein